MDLSLKPVLLFAFIVLVISETFKFQTYASFIYINLLAKTKYCNFNITLTHVKGAYVLLQEARGVTGRQY